MPLLTLNQINRDKTVQIHHVVDSPWSARLTEMGFLPGHSTAVIRKSPFGSTLYVRMNSSRIALRRIEAEQVIIMESE